MLNSNHVVEFEGVHRHFYGAMYSFNDVENVMTWDVDDREKYGRTWADKTREEKDAHNVWQRDRAASKAVAEGREPGLVGRPPRLTPEEKEASRIAQNKRRTKRTLAKRTAARAIKAIAAGRVPGQAGQPRVLTDEQRIAGRQATHRKYRLANLDDLRARDKVIHKQKTADRAIAEGRVPGVLGHLATFSAADLAAYMERWPRDKDVYHARIHTHNSRAKRLGIPGVLTAMDVREAYVAQGGHCGFCEKPFNDEIPEIDHWMPIVLGGSNTPENIRLLHKVCNRTKAGKHPAVFGLSCVGV